MGKRSMVPTLAEAESGWTDPTWALAFDGQKTKFPPNTSPRPWLRLFTLTNRDLPEGDEPVGFKVYVLRGTGFDVAVPDGQYASLEVALSVDGENPVGDIRRVDATMQTIEVGAPDDDWDAGLTAEDLASEDFSILIRKPGQVDEYQASELRIDLAYVEVTHTFAGGSFELPNDTSLQRLQIGLETTRGADIACPILIRSANILIQPKVEQEEIRSQGEVLPDQFPVVTDMADLALSGKLCANEVGYWLASAGCKPTTQTLVTASGGDPAVYGHTFLIFPEFASDPRSFNIERGYGHPVRSTYGLLNNFGISTARRSNPSINGSGFARKITEGITLTAGANEVQTLTITGSPTGGNYKLSFKGSAPTANIAHNANAATVQSALEALATIGSGNVAVSGSGPYTVTFQGALAGENQQLLVLADNSLTGGTSPSVTIAETTRGGHTVATKAILVAGKVSHFYAAAIADLASNKVAKLFTAEFKIGNRFSDVWYQSGGDNFEDHAHTPASITTDVMIEDNTFSGTVLADARAQSLKYYRMLFEGNTIRSGYAYSMRITKAVRASLIQQYGDHENVWARSFQLSAVKDPAWGGAAIEIYLVNTTSGY